MNILQAVFILCLSTSLVKSVPLSKSPLYDDIVEKCPSVESHVDFANEPLFRSCNDWNKMSLPQTNLTKVGIRCLLFFYNFVQYCESQGDKVNTTVDKSKLQLYSLDVICDKKEIPPQIDSNSSLYKILANETICKQICSDDVGWVDSLCKFAYYYKHLLVVAPPKLAESSHLIHVNSNKAITTPTEVADTTKGVNVNQAQHVSANEKSEKEKLQAHTPVEGNTNTDTEPSSDHEHETQTHHSFVPKSKVKDVQPPHGDQKVEPLIPPHPNESDKALQSTKENKLVDSIIPKQIKDNTKPNTAAVNNQSSKPATVEDDQDPSNQIADTVPLDRDPTQDNEGSEEDIEDAGDGHAPEPPVNDVKNDKSLKPSETDDDSNTLNYSTEMEGDSYFFTYFMLLCIFFIVGYVCYHNKQKILALILEGRRGKRQYRGKRPNSANYHKLDSNLEEAINSTVNKNTNNVIY